jgi:hypothetical protein
VSLASARAIREGLVLAQWTTTELWRATLAIGGSFTVAHVTDIASGVTDATSVEHDVLATTFNEHFAGLGGDHPVPTWDRLSPP